MKLKIDNRELEVDEEISIYHAAKRVGIDIPVMCYEDGYDYFTSCMICEVKDKTSGRVFPACSAKIADGMEIETQSQEIREARKATLELLLSEHVGDCEAPCQRLCALSSEIPKMIREIKDDRLGEAIATVRRDIALASILERFCNAPCEKGCRRGQHDDGVSIRHLTRYVSDWDLKRDEPYLPPTKPASGRSVAVVGAGSSGLATAYYLALEGHQCTVCEQDDETGGSIRSEFDRDLLPDWVIEGELGLLRRLGVRFETGSAVDRDGFLDELGARFDAVVLAMGETDPADLESMGLSVTEKKGLVVNSKTTMTARDGVFAGGSLVKKGMPILKLVQNAKLMASCVSQFINGDPIDGIRGIYNHSMGRLQEGEIDIFVSGADPIARVEPDNLESDGFSDPDAKLESGRCMHCDCRAAHDCSLRTYSEEYRANQNHFKGEAREKFVHINQDAGAVYEPGKCIKCGLCVRVTKKEGEHFGFTFVGRGFDLKAGVSLDKPLNQGLEKVAEKVVDACPTGALARNEKLQE